MGKTTIKTLERRINAMKPKRKKRRVTRHRAKPLATHHRRKRRKRGLLHDRGGLMTSIKAQGAGAVGGILLNAIEKLPITNQWLKIASGFAGAIILGSYFNAPNISAGLSGATAYIASKNLFPSLLHDGLEAISYVDPSTLCDSGYTDEHGNAIVQDGDGVMYALNDGGDLVAVGDAYSLHDGYSLHDSMQSVSMIPLSDPYSLHDRFDI